MRDKQAFPSGLTSLIGTPITDVHGKLRGKLKDIAVGTGTEAGSVVGIVFKSRQGTQLIAAKDVLPTPGGTLAIREGSQLQQLRGDETFIFLRQDLLDRQIIDV